MREYRMREEKKYRRNLQIHTNECVNSTFLQKSVHFKNKGVQKITKTYIKNVQNLTKIYKININAQKWVTIKLRENDIGFERGEILSKIIIKRE